MNQKRLPTLLVSVCLTLAIVFLVVGCTAPAPSPTPTATLQPTATPTSTPKPAPIVLKFAIQSPQNSLPSLYGYTPRKAQIEEATHGAVTVEMYYAETLGKQSEQWNMARTGVCDITWTISGLIPGQFPFSEIVTLPFLPHAASMRFGSASLSNLYDKFKAQIDKEFSDVKLLVLMSSQDAYIATNKPIRTMEDLKGMKIRAVAGPPTEALKRLGAVPMVVNTPDIYQAMSTGLIDGYSTPQGTASTYKLQEVAKYFLFVPLNIQVQFEVMNLKRWNSFSPLIQEEIMSVSGRWGTDFYVREYGERKNAEDGAILEKAGGIFSELSPAELQRWTDTVRPMWDAYVTNLEAKGLPGKAALQEILRFDQVYKSQNH